MGRGGSKKSKPIPASHHKLKSCLIPAPPPLRDGENPRRAKRDGAKFSSLSMSVFVLNNYFQLDLIEYILVLLMSFFWCFQVFGGGFGIFIEQRIKMMVLIRGSNSCLCQVCVVLTHEYSTIWVNPNLTCLLNELGFFNLNTIHLLNGQSYRLVYKILSKRRKKKNFSINQIDMNYEKLNK